jgi:glycosyltransferase involved in cell wall biosynthesis
VNIVPNHDKIASSARGSTASDLPRVSIGIPVYNGEEFLGEALDALLNQSYTNFELIISDNASTDRTADICERYQKRDSRIRYVRQPRNIGMIANHNFLVGEARGEFFKWASHDDLYAPNYLECCVTALDEHPSAVLAHSAGVLLNPAGERIGVISSPEGTASPQAVERMRARLFDGKGDWIYSVMRIATLRRTPLHPTYHGVEKTLITELALHGPFYQVPEESYFRRDHPYKQHRATRDWSALLDPRRANRLRNPAVRLYLEYIWGYFSAIRRAPLSRAEKGRCYSLLTRWLASRALPDRQPPEGSASFRTQPFLYLSRALTARFSHQSAAPPGNGQTTVRPS